MPDGGNLSARRLSFAYDGRTVLRGLGLDVAPGEIVGLLGPNGSGKSTLIKVLTGVHRAYEGSATLDGREVLDFPRRELARQVAVVQQEPSFSFAFTALEIVLMGRHPHLAGLASPGGVHSHQDHIVEAAKVIVAASCVSSMLLAITEPVRSSGSLEVTKSIVVLSVTVTSEARIPPPSLPLMMLSVTVT